MLPIENSLEGAVSATLDLLIHETSLQIAGELVVPVRHFLITRPGVTLADIRVVTSHPNPFGQCRRFLDRCLPGVEQLAALSTALAVQEVVQGTDSNRAAIGTARAAELYGGTILAHDIQDTHSNVTRFVVLAREDMPPTGDDKTSLGFRMKENVPGALHRILTEFADEQIQLTKIESRPTKSLLGDYVILIDLEGHRLDPRIAAVLDRVRERASMLKIFGSYPRFPLETLQASFAAPQPID